MRQQEYHHAVPKPCSSPGLVPAWMIMAPPQPGSNRFGLGVGMGAV